MLELKNITKTYVTGDLRQDALKNVSVNFRKNEFVSILGHSGSGKTTMLNIIGGLDQYTSGDLVINGVSTARYRDRDWDIYRNHSVGFVFQNYNLIPHQTVLANVELALTLSGISKKERSERAAKALAQVGLADQTHKRPNQLSGGQMQRVAIARAIINDPDILLADEPTGALDSDTSVQVMALLKEIASDRLVIMVTHNSELAAEYSTRIVRLVDGEITDDSDPFIPSADVLPATKRKKTRRAERGRSMSLTTAFSLSLNNLMTKKARTLLTSFAGSIGILGIALILSVSTGFQNYIDRIQEDTLSTYPLTIISETADMTSIMASAADAAEQIEQGERDVTEQQMISGMFAQIGTNNIAAFKKYFEANKATLDGSINAVRYGYDLTPQIFSSDTSNGAVQVNPSTVFSSYMASAASFSYSNANVFSEMLDNQELIDSQYEVLSGRWPQNGNELVMVLARRNSLPDYIVYALGLRDQAELDAMVEKVMNGEKVENLNDPMEWDYDDFIGMSFKLVPAASYYKYNPDYKVWEDMRDDAEYMSGIVDNGDDLTVVGVVCPRDGVSASALSTGIAYTSQLTDTVIAAAADTDIVRAQKENPDVDVFTGRSFDELENAEDDRSLDFNDMISVDADMLSSAFGTTISKDKISALMSAPLTSISGAITTDTAPATTAFADALEALAVDMLTDYVSANADPASGVAMISLADVDSIVVDYLAGDSATAIISPLSASYAIPPAAFSQIYSPLLSGLVSGYINAYALALSADPLTTPAPLTAAAIPTTVSGYRANAVVAQSCAAMGAKMTETAMQANILKEVSTLATKLVAETAGSFRVDADKLASAFSFNLDEQELSRLMQAYISTDNTASSAEANLSKLGYSDRTTPTSMSIYLVDFDGKERFKAFIENYNTRMEAEEKDEYVINYTDITGILMSSVKTIVDSVTYVLIAFVAISLVVSSIMIGVITFISVLERTKEIGILRAVGASKKDISRVFNAETVMIGLAAGLIGIGCTLLLLIPINLLLHSLTGVATLNAVLPAGSSIILIAISVLLTFISGLLPSGKAARKNPVEALRTE